VNALLHRLRTGSLNGDVPPATIPVSLTDLIDLMARRKQSAVTNAGDRVDYSTLDPNLLT